MIELYNKSYFDIHTSQCSVDDDEFKSMGFAGIESAYARYRVVDNILSRINSSGSSILDAGAGTGAIWTKEFVCHHKPSEILLMEPYEKYLPKLSSVSDRLKGLGFNSSIVQSTIIEFNGVYDITLAIGSLNYYKLLELLQLLDKLLSLTLKVLIFEVNVQSPITPVSPHGNFNPGIGAIYEHLCMKNVRLTVDIIRKYTTIWTVIKD